MIYPKPGQSQADIRHRNLSLFRCIAEMVQLDVAWYSKITGFETVRPADKFELWKIFKPRYPLNQCLVGGRCIPPIVQFTQVFQEHLNWQYQGSCKAKGVIEAGY